ncbi:MAG: DEAD/DEAH box helicase [Deltaproteobacteria bacterium]|nr:DEAD/DEAH box helicase [Deltaproteobacteria bacterium]
MSFEAFELHPRVAAGVEALGYVAPTPIQRASIPHILRGRDVLGLAQTGTGKTAAFALPILQRLSRGPARKVRALVVAPTRELAEQIHQSFGALGGGTRVRSTTVYGGVGVNPQVERLRAGVEIVVACPGRLLDHIGQRTIDLSGVEVLVLDEADRMFDMGFLPDIRRLLKHLPAERQTLLFSATMPSDVRHLADEVLRDPVTVQVDPVAPAATVDHSLYPVPHHLKTPLLLNLLERTEAGSVLVFTRTKHRAKRVAEQLERAGHGATCLQGNLSQNRRQAALDGFRDGTFQILVATDIAARGIDVSSVSHVVNYDMPDTVDAYTHRIGRTGRAARTGDAFTFVTREDDDMVRAIEKALGARVERRTVPGFDYSVAAPKRDLEFARPPRQPRAAPKAAAPKGERSHASQAPRPNGATPAAPRAPLSAGRRFQPRTARARPR